MSFDTHWSFFCKTRAIWAEKKVTDGSAQKVGDALLLEMIGAVVDQMAALTKAPKVAEPVVGRVMIEMRLDGPPDPLIEDLRL